MGDRRRILLAVEPRVLADALAEVLDAVGLDEVLFFRPSPAEETDVHLDAAIVTRDDLDVAADVLIRVTTDSDAHVTTSSRKVNVSVRTPQQLLAVLDEFCPTSALRVKLTGSNGAGR